MNWASSQWEMPAPETPLRKIKKKRQGQSGTFAIPMSGKKKIASIIHKRDSLTEWVEETGITKERFANDQRHTKKS